MKEEIEKWYAKQTNRNVEEFDDYDKHICNVVLKWQQQVNSVDLADVVGRSEQLVCYMCNGKGYTNEDNAYQCDICKGTGKAN